MKKYGPGHKYVVVVLVGLEFGPLSHLMLSNNMGDYEPRLL